MKRPSLLSLAGIPAALALAVFVWADLSPGPRAGALKAHAIAEDWQFFRADGRAVSLAAINAAGSRGEAGKAENSSVECRKSSQWLQPAAKRQDAEQDVPGEWHCVARFSRGDEGEVYSTFTAFHAGFVFRLLTETVDGYIVTPDHADNQRIRLKAMGLVAR